MFKNDSAESVNQTLAKIGTILHFPLNTERLHNLMENYVVSRNQQIVAIEVKAGTKGSMQSLYSFMELKKTALGIRTSLENFGRIGNVDIYPLYAIENFL